MNRATRELSLATSFVVVGLGPHVGWAHLPDGTEGGLRDASALVPHQSRAGVQHPSLDCGYRSPAEWMTAVRAAVRRGEIADSAQRHIPAIAPSHPRGPGGTPRGEPCLTRAHIFPYEDTAGVLLTDFSDGQLIAFMVQAANALLAAHGDQYDFVGFWLNYTPHHTLGAAFYVAIENDVSGIGDPSTLGTPIFNHRPAVGLGGDKIQGFIGMWDINSGYWEPGNGPEADFTRLALAHEFEHRFSVFLPPLLDGRILQGNDASCGRTFHWNWKVDGQGSAMEISEWVGANPATLEGSFVTFNTDISGGVFSYTDLYLMGYVSPAEMDAGNSQLRFMNNSTCAATYSGPITSFNSSSIIASAGPRIPDSAASQKHYRAGWIMIHLPGAPPSPSELDMAVGILRQGQTDWSHSTLERGSMDHSLFSDCNCNGLPDAADIQSGVSHDANGNGVPDECDCLGDLDGDRDVDLADLAHLLTNFGMAAGTEPDDGDLDDDADVDLADLALLLSGYGRLCTS